MSNKSKLIAIGMVWLMIFAAFVIMVSSVTAESREDVAPLPSWEQGDLWKYRFDDTRLATYVMFRVTYTYNDGTAQYQMQTECRMMPTDDVTERVYQVSDILPEEYQMTLTFNGWENGTWGTYITDTGGTSDFNVGDVIDDGTYTRIWSMTGTAYHNMNNLNFKRGTSQWHDFTDAVDDGNNANENDLSWTLTVDDDITENTLNGDEDILKPTWNAAPMKVGDSWTQTNQYTMQIEEDYQWGGVWSDGGSISETRNYYWDFAWQVVSKSRKSISNTKMGTNTFEEAYKLTRSGSYDWDRVVDGQQTSGTETPDPYEMWYGTDGDQFDAGWIIEYNQQSRLYWSTYIDFQNSPPELISEPAASYDINEDEVWDFTNGQDYAVSDPDQDEAGGAGAGDLIYSISAELDGDPNVLTGLSIDTNGDISFTPTQGDVADGYTVTINVTDQYDKDPMSIEFSFTVNVLNTNDAPSALSTVMEDFEMNEGEEYSPSWKLSDVFSDPDMDKNPLNNDNPYDPNEELTFSVSNNGSIRVKCPNKTDLGPTNQCDMVTFEAMDGKFPRDLPVTMTITATDKTGAKTNDKITINVKHVNHVPVVDPDFEDDFEMDEDTTDTLDLKSMFLDIDVGNSNYPTNDALTYDKDGEQNLKISITGSKAKIEPDANWNGEEEITFEARDKSGAKAELDLTIVVLPVNDAPVIETTEPVSDLSIDETDTAEEDGDLEKETFSVVASDIDITTGQNDVLTYNWTVEDGDNGDIYDDIDPKADYEFETAFDGDFEDGNFHGGDSSKTYIVTCIVSDGTVDVEAKKWFVQIRNVNRDPVVYGIEVFMVSKAGSTTPQSEKSPGNYSAKFGKIYRFDVTNLVTDLDEGIDQGEGTENIDELTFEWSSHIDGVIGTSASIDVASGKSSSFAEFKLKDGKKHIITLRVTDNDGDFDEYVFTVKTAKNPTVSPGFEMVLMVGAVVAAVAILSYRRKK